MAERKKNRAAVSMGRRRWAGVSKEERSAAAKKAVDAREAKRAAKKNEAENPAKTGAFPES